MGRHKEMFTKRIIVIVFIHMNFAMSLPEKSVENIHSSSPSSQENLDQVKNIGMPLLVKKLNGLSVPDVSGVTKTPLGKVEYNLKSIKLSGVALPKSKVSVDPGKKIVVTANEGNLDLGAKWHYREKAWPHISDSGTCNISMRGLSLAITMKFDKIFADDSQMNDVGCHLSIGKLKVKFFGKVGWLYNLFSGVLASKMKPDLEKQICSTASNVVKGEGIKALMTLPGVVGNVKTPIRPNDSIR